LKQAMVTPIVRMRIAPRGTRPPTIPPIIEQAELCAAFDRALAAVEERWPEAPVRDAAFPDYVLGHVGAERDTARLPRLRFEDLFLAWWAMTAPGGVAAFLEEFHADLVREIACITSRFTDVDARMLLDDLMIELFDGDEPRIAEFTGFGSLRAWVEVVSTQIFLDRARYHRR
jgi:hypothetical protein